MQLCHYNCKRQKQKRNPIKNGLLNAKCTQLAGNAGGQIATTIMRTCKLAEQPEQAGSSVMRNKSGDVHRRNQNVKTVQSKVARWCQLHSAKTNAITHICYLQIKSSQDKLAAPQYRKGDSHRQIMNVNQPRLGYSVSNALSRHKRKYSHNHQADGYLQTKHAEQSGQADSSPQTIGKIIATTRNKLHFWFDQKFGLTKNFQIWV